MTPIGRRLLVTSATIYVVGTWLGYRELNLLGAAGLLLVLMAVATVARPVTLTAERRLVPDRVRVGHDAEGTVTVTNNSTRRSPALLGVETIGPDHNAQPSPGGRAPHRPTQADIGGVELGVSRLRPQRAQTLAYPLPTTRRAVLQVGPFVVTRADPFGIIERRTKHGEPARFWVHPRVHPIAPLPLGRQRDLEGPTNESARGESVFHSLRDYVIGDDLRRVHWKATAHHGSLMVKEHADPVRPDATVVLDDRTGSSLDPHGFDLAVEAVASVAVVARRAGFPVQLLSASGAVHTTAVADDNMLLDLLAGITQHPDDQVAGVTQRLPAGPGGRALVVVTGRPSPEELSRWAAAGRRFGLVVVIAVLATDGDTPSGPSAGVGNGTRPDADLPPAPAGVRLLAVRSPDALIAGWGGLR